MKDRPFPRESDWASLSHAYGPAVDTPGHLAALRSADATVREKAWADLIGSANHQGDLYPVTPWIVSPLIDLAVDPDYPDRVMATAHVTLIVEDLNYSLDRPDDLPPEVMARYGRRESQRDRWLIECRTVTAGRAFAILALATDDDPEIRVWALRLVGVLARAGGDISNLHTALIDSDPRIRAVALWQLQITTSDQHEVAARAARLAAGVPSNGLDYFVANVVFLAADREHRDAARQVVRLQEMVLPEFESASLHHVAESPLEFAAVLAGVGSEIELEALAR